MFLMNHLVQEIHKTMTNADHKLSELKVMYSDCLFCLNDSLIFVDYALLGLLLSFTFGAGFK